MNIRSLLGKTAALAAGLTFFVGQAQAIDIKMWALSGEMEGFVAKVQAEYQKSHPDVNIVFESFPNEAYKTQLQVGLTGSAPPDIFFNWTGEDAARLVRDGLALDLTEVKGGFKQSLSDVWLSAFQYNGRIYGVPTDAVSKYFYYNPSFFTEHKLAPPTTFGGLLKLCRQIRAIDPQIVPWPLGNSERWKLNHVITMLNERVMGQKATAADYDLSTPAEKLFTNPGYAEAWQKVVDLKDAGCFQDAPNATSPEASRSMFAAGVSPMIYCGTWCHNIFREEGYSDFAMFRFPAVEGGAGDPGAGFLSAQGYMISAKTKHPKEVVDWLNFLVSDEIAAKSAEVLGVIPSNPARINTIKATDQYKWIVNDIARASGAVKPIDVLLDARVANAYLDAGVEVLNGTKTPQQAMNDIRATALEAQSSR